MTMPPVESTRRMGATRIRDLLTRLKDCLAAARAARDVEAIHDARVASRRLRAALQLFRDCFPNDPVKKWRRRLRRLTRSLGAARDLDVHIAYVRDVLAEVEDKSCRGGVKRLLLRLDQRRRAAQPRVVRQIDRVESRMLLGDMYAAAERTLFALGPVDDTPPGACFFEAARKQVRRRMGELTTGAACLSAPTAVDAHHRLRIAAKRLRYTLELCNGACEQLKEFVKAAKSLQSILGDVHDRDVWLAELAEFPEDERRRMMDYFNHARPLKRLLPGIEFMRLRLQHERSQRFEQAVALWNTLLQRRTWERLGELMDGLSAEPSDPPIGGREDSAAQPTRESG